MSKEKPLEDSAAELPSIDPELRHLGLTASTPEEIFERMRDASSQSPAEVLRNMQATADAANNQWD